MKTLSFSFVLFSLIFTPLVSCMKPVEIQPEPVPEIPLEFENIAKNNIYFPKDYDSDIGFIKFNHDTEFELDLKNEVPFFKSNIESAQTLIDRNDKVSVVEWTNAYKENYLEKDTWTNVFQEFVLTSNSELEKNYSRDEISEIYEESEDGSTILKENFILNSVLPRTKYNLKNSTVSGVYLDTVDILDKTNVSLYYVVLQTIVRDEIDLSLIPVSHDTESAFDFYNRFQDFIMENIDIQIAIVKISEFNLTVLESV